jgi:hypothetical protein
MVDEKVIDRETVDLSNEKQDGDRLRRWLEQLDPDDMTKCRCRSFVGRPTIP